MIVEGVTYHRYVVSFRLASGQRRRWVRWSPAAYFLSSEIQRELEDRFTEAELPSGPDGSNVYVSHHPRCSGCASC